MSTGGARRRQPGREAGQMIVLAALAMVAIVAGVALVWKAATPTPTSASRRIPRMPSRMRGRPCWHNGSGAPPRTTRTSRPGCRTSRTTTASPRSRRTTPTCSASTSPAPGSSPRAPASGSRSARVGPGLPPPPKAQGVRVTGVRSFGTTFGRAIGLNSLDASADATAVMGRLTGGTFLPMVLPVSPIDCLPNGMMQPFDDPNKTSMWFMSNPGSTHPDGTEYVVPLCKDGGSFMFLDLDPNLDCGRGSAHAAGHPVRHVPGRRGHRRRGRLPEEGRRRDRSPRASRDRSS